MNEAIENGTDQTEYYHIYITYIMYILHYYHNMIRKLKTGEFPASSRMMEKMPVRSLMNLFLNRFAFKRWQRSAKNSEI